MRRAVLLIAGVSLAFAPAPFPRPGKSDPTTDHLKQMQGKWLMLSRTYGGEPDSHIVTAVEVSGNRWTYINGDGSWRSTWSFSLDGRKSPPQFNSRYKAAGWEEVPVDGLLQGVYKITGDTLIICYTEDTPNRPSTFDGQRKGVYLDVLKREKH
jgi:uncharacterized protein (TIGR03067 family)